MPVSHMTWQAEQHLHEPDRESYFKQLEIVSDSYIYHYGS